MTEQELILVGQGRAFMKNGTGRAVRLAHHLSLRDFGAAMAEHLGRPVSPTTVHRYENQQRVADAEHAVAYARLVNALLAGKANVR